MQQIGWVEADSSSFLSVEATSYFTSSLFSADAVSSCLSSLYCSFSLCTSISLLIVISSYSSLHKIAASSAWLSLSSSSCFENSKTLADFSHWSLSSSKSRFCTSYDLSFFFVISSSFVNFRISISSFSYFLRMYWFSVWICSIFVESSSIFWSFSVFSDSRISSYSLAWLWNLRESYSMNFSVSRSSSFCFDSQQEAI